MHDKIGENLPPGTASCGPAPGNGGRLSQRPET